MSEEHGRGGCETMVHTIQRLLEEKDDKLTILQVDYKNAFNYADRASTFLEVKEHFPELSLLVANCYGVAAQLVFGDTIIFSSRGWHQGDVLASLIYSPWAKASRPQDSRGSSKSPSSWLDPGRWNCCRGERRCQTRNGNSSERKSSSWS